MRDEFTNTNLWTKRFLPHYEAPAKFQMITYRLADSLPQSVLNSINVIKPSVVKENHELEKRRIIENTLDSGYGSCLLANPVIAKFVIDNWLYYKGKKYELIAYVVMPNHVHTLIKTYEGHTLGQIVWAWKSYVSKFVFQNPDYKEIFLKSFNERAHIYSSKIPEERKAYVVPADGCACPGKVRFWNREYWDRFIRDKKHFDKAIAYIHNNPVKAGLVSSPEGWQWSSACKNIE